MVAAINRPKLWRIDTLKVKLYRCVMDLRKVLFQWINWSSSCFGGLLRANRPGSSLREHDVAFTGYLNCDITGNLDNEANKLDIVKNESNR